MLSRFRMIPSRREPPTTLVVLLSAVLAATWSSSGSLGNFPVRAAGLESRAGASCTNAGKVARWSLNRRAAQLVVVPSLGFSVSALKPLAAEGVGGVLPLGNSVPSDLGARVATLNRSASPVKLFVMADEEGGGVQRLLGLVASFPWARQMAETMTPNQVRTLAGRVGRQMLAAGVKADLAPVLDVDGGVGPNSRDADGYRSFSASARTVSKYGVAFLRGLRQAGVLPVVKHFPGLGESSGNTDYGPVDTLPYSVLKHQGLTTFMAAFAAGAPAVMISNATVPGLTKGPASIAPAAIRVLLRHDLGFHGLVLTDSLSAGAISSAGFNVPAAAAKAVEAGADMVLFGSTLTRAQTRLLSPVNVRKSTTAIVNALVGAVHSHALPTARLNNAVLDVLKAKHANLCVGSGR